MLSWTVVWPAKSPWDILHIHKHLITQMTLKEWNATEAWYVLWKNFLEILPKYNEAVFDNGQKNQSYNDDILSLLPRLQNIDLAYFDPPYCDSHADYQGFYHLLETYTEYWKDKQFVNGTKRYEPQRHSGFDKKTEIVDSFKELFCLSQHIPYWIISYNDRSFPDINSMISLIEPYRNVRVKDKMYCNSKGGKGSVAGSSEILLICTPKQTS